MQTDEKTAADIDQYISTFPPDVQAILERVRATIRKAAPKATETISYRIPAFKLNGPLVYFAGFKNHIGLYPPFRDPGLRREAAQYSGPKGNLKFPLDKPIPYALIGKIVKSRMKENESKTAAKTAARRKVKR